ncbi:MAG: RagB/SusD family nutrient uptake outer membrane protein [Paludibacteraceae bacterium]|nr:RagB/SusD family nutrient uptake outer membrane protein [Paludibacteraceae bacterium]
MKKTLYIIGLTIAVLLSSCSDNWLNQQPGGSTITEEQYQNMDGVLKGSVMGVYAMMYQYGDHDVFGQRSIDMYGDLTCGDMAMTTQNYGWFYSDELGQSYARRAYLWSYYYDIIRLTNKAINAVHAQVGKEGLMEVDTVLANAESFFYYAEVLAMRGWAYANLQKWFCYTPEQIITQGYTLDDYMSVPVYTEEVTEADTIIGAPLSSAEDVYRRAESDLKDAIYYFDILENEGMVRTIKHEMNSDVARLTLAYLYLNKGDNENAAKYAEEFINNTTHTLLPYSQLLTTGFADVANNNWVWGQDVSVETTTALGSFFGQVDVFSYSYAWAGDIKGIDELLLKSIKDKKWDARQYWFNNIYEATKECQYAPDGKFYSPAAKQKNNYKRKPKAEEIDRDWLCDNVYMRTELAYIIAAEAYCRINDNANAQKYLLAITDQRTLPEKVADYEAWKTSLSDNTVLLEEIRYNWRTEFWGEGFGLQTFRRFGKQVSLGDNHKRSNKTPDPNAESSMRQFTFEIPSGEQYYNPFLRSTTELAVKQN